MAQTFDIRFARSAGLAGLFEAPANEFRWKGAGRLSIDASGISIAVKRGLLTLFARARSHRIAPNSLLEVYREGNALRLEFSTRDSSRAVLPIWVSDGKAAAQIVTLLPTQRTVELEDGAGSTGRYRFDRRLVALLLIGVIVAIGALMLPQYLEQDLAIPLVEATQPTEQTAAPVAPQDSVLAPPTPDALTEVGPPTPASEKPSARFEPEVRDTRYLDPARFRAPSMEASTGSAVAGVNEPTEIGESMPLLVGQAATDGSVPIAPVESTHAIALDRFIKFKVDRIGLRVAYRLALESGSYERMQEVEARWLAVTSRIVNDTLFMGGEFYGLREMQLAISRNWRDHIRILAAGLRTGDQRLINLADTHLGFAEDLEAQLSEFEP